ncbi:MAG: translation initiation factor IF-3 [Gammaproteobacteria bacterium]
MVAEKKNRVNDEISVPRVRVIGADGTQVGILSTDDAVRMAEELSLDLVEIQPTADPPVCRIMDFGKFLFDQNKKRHAAKRKQKIIQIKEVKFRPGTDDADYKIKVRNLLRFLEEGDKVKVTLRFRGREMAHQELGAEMLKRVEQDLADNGSIEQYPKMEGRQMIMVIAPKKTA